MAKLVAIGDSLTQGFQSGAIFHTEKSFPAMIARSMGLDLLNDFCIPRFPGDGLPLNIEALLRWMETQLGSRVQPHEWILQFPFLFANYADQVEDLYERGRGSRPVSFGGTYHNLGVWGFRVIDSLTFNTDYCRQAINRDEGWIKDDFLGLPSAPMYRTALRVLNPKLRLERNTWTQLDNLQHISETEGVENLIIWLGSNDCLDTVVSLKLRDMTSPVDNNDSIERRKYNLTHPDVFEGDYTAFINRVKSTISDDTKVFVGTIPEVTIPPITQGLGFFDGNYFDNYGRFFADDSNFSRFLHPHLTREEAMLIDRRIGDFNQIIKTLVANQGENWHIVDTGQILKDLAVKRNNALDTPERVLRDYYGKLDIADHPLLRLDPIPSTLRLDTQDNQRDRGGFFSLDCVHPTTIGYGIIAEAFLRTMNFAGVENADPIRLNWAEIINQDTLLQSPPLLWDDIVQAAQNNSTLWNLIFSFTS